MKLYLGTLKERKGRKRLLNFPGFHDSLFNRKALCATKQTHFVFVFCDVDEICVAWRVIGSAPEVAKHSIKQ